MTLNTLFRSLCGNQLPVRRSLFKKTCFKFRTCFSTSQSQSLLSNKIEMAESTPIGHTAPKELSIPVPWGHLAAKEWGSPYGKPVLGIHGWQDNAGTFDTLAPLLPSGWHFVCLELSGHGLSSPLPPGMSYTFVEYLTEVKRAINYLNWKKFSYIGHSMGGGLGMVLAGTYPDLIDNLVAIDIIKLLTVPTSKWKAKTVGTGIDLMLEMEQKDNANAIPSYSMDEARQRLLESTGTALTKESASILLKRGTRPTPDGRVVYTRDRRIQLPTIFRVLTDQYRILVEQISTNLLILKAKDGPNYEPKEVYDEFVQLYRTSCPVFKYVEVEGTHHVHLNNPENVASHIVQFLNQPSRL